MIVTGGMLLSQFYGQQKGALLVEQVMRNILHTVRHEWNDKKTKKEMIRTCECTDRMKQRGKWGVTETVGR
jgi:hypothetical protein